MTRIWNFPCKPLTIDDDAGSIILIRQLPFASFPKKFSQYHRFHVVRRNYDAQFHGKSFFSVLYRDFDTFSYQLIGTKVGHSRSLCSLSKEAAPLRIYLPTTSAKLCGGITQPSAKLLSGASCGRIRVGRELEMLLIRRLIGDVSAKQLYQYFSPRAQR